MTEITPDNITDEQFESYFNNKGKIEVNQPPVDETPVKNDTKEETSQHEVEKEEQKRELKPTPPDNKVNHGALHEERMRRKEATERAKALEEKNAELMRKIQEFQNTQQQVQQNYYEEPDVIETLRQEQEQLKQIMLAQANKAIAQTNEEKFWSKVKASENAYKQDVPDFDDAVKFLADTRLDELKDLGWSDVEASKILHDEVKWITEKAYADEINPAERFYTLAKRRGFNSKKDIDNSADIKLNTIKKGLDTNMSLPPASASVRQDITAEALADMSISTTDFMNGNSEFDKAWAKLFGR